MGATLPRALGRAVEFIFGGSRNPKSGESPCLRILDYQDEAVFFDLWLRGLESECAAMGDIAANLGHPKRQLLIIGNDPPDGVFRDQLPMLRGINFQSHLTATSWLAAWKVKFTPSGEQRENGKTEPLARIAVLDPRETSLAGGAAGALQTIFSAQDSDSRPLVPRATVMNAPSVDAICRWLRESKADTRPTGSHVRDLIKSTIWNELTSARERHHALSNGLGALLLSARFETRRDTPIKPCIQDYLVALIQACGIGAEAGPLLGVEQPRSIAWVIPDLRAETRAVLVDDMAELWQDFLVGALGFNDGELGGRRHRPVHQNFVPTSSAEFRRMMLSLPDRLTKLLAEGRRWLTVSDLIPGKHPFESDFVLFLDLRLFPNDRRSADSFHEQLVKVGKQVLAERSRPLPWLDGRRFVELEQELDGEAIAAHPRETLLPRILGLLDPTLPIVIFSSTHRTELIEPFREYGNIITTFRKPMLSGLTRSWDEMVSELRADFVSSMEQAARILGVRRRLARLLLKKPVAPTRRPASGKGRVIEIYIDESGDPFNKRDPGFAVGGIMLEHESEQAQSAFHRAINGAPKKWGVSDYAPDRIRANEVAEKLPRIAFYPKRPDRGSQEEIDGLACVSASLNNGTRIAAFAIVEPELLHFYPDTRMDSGILFDRNSLDNVYHFLLCANLEVLLFEHPWVDLTRGALHIHVATRDQKVRHGLTRRIWQKAYGLTFKERRGDWYYTSLRGDSVYRIIAAILRGHDVYKDRPNILTARGVTLNDYEEIVRNWREDAQTPRLNSQLYDPSRLDPKQIHYLADWMVRMALYRSKDLPAPAAEWFRAGYIQTVNARFLALLDACRLSKAGKSIGRLSRLKLSTEESVRTGISAERYLRQTASTWPEQLSGDDLRALFREPSVRPATPRADQSIAASPTPNQVGPKAALAENQRAVAQGRSIADDPNQVTLSKPIGVAPIRRRVLIEAPVECDIDGFLADLQQIEGIPRPVAFRVFESAERVEFIFDIASAEEVRKLVSAPLNVRGMTVRAIDVTLPATERIAVCTSTGSGHAQEG